MIWFVLDHLFFVIEVLQPGIPEFIEKLSQSHWFWNTFWVSLRAILSEFGSLGPSWDHLGISKAFQASTLEDFSSKWWPHLEPKHHTGGLQVGVGACNDVFSKGLFQDLHFTPNQIAKTDPKRCFFWTAWHGWNVVNSVWNSHFHVFVRLMCPKLFWAPFWGSIWASFCEPESSLVRLSVLEGGLVWEALPGGPQK